MTDRASTVFETQVEFEGETLSACYFVDHLGVIHTSIDGIVKIMPAGAGPAEEVVKSMIRGHMTNRARRGDLLGKWSASTE